VRLTKLFAVALFATSFAHSALGGGESRKDEPLSQKDAREVATKAFLEATKGSIPKYSVKSIDDAGDKDAWRFRFQGSEQYARPGAHAIVKVDKRTAKTEVLLGE